MELRWLVRKNKVTTEEIKAYASRNIVSFNYAKAALEDLSVPVLQYRQGMGFDWHDVVEVVKYYEADGKL